MVLLVDNLSNLQSLQSLDIRANYIGNIADLNCLSKVKCFALWLISCFIVALVARIHRFASARS